MKYVRNCDQCRRRKLKCNRQQPCGPCCTQNKADACVFSGVPGENTRSRTGSAATSPLRDSAQPTTLQSIDPRLAASRLQEGDDLLPSDEDVKRLADAYFFEQDKGTTSYVLTRQHFYQNRSLAGTDPAWRALVCVVCGLGAMIAPDGDQQVYVRLFAMAKRLLDMCKIDEHPSLVHVRILFLFLVGQGPLRGPLHAAGWLQRAIYVAHVLNLQLDPPPSLSIEERQDRVLLFTTLAKADWFSALGLERSFYVVRPTSPILLPFFASSVQSPSYEGVVFDKRSNSSVRIANLCRRMVDRKSMTLKDSYTATMELQTEMLALEGRAHPPTSYEPSAARANGSTPPVAPIRQMMSAHMWRALHQPFYHLGWTEEVYSTSRDICFQSAVANVNHLGEFFGDWLSQSTQPSPLKKRRTINSTPSAPIGVTIIWYHIVNYIRCALLVHQHLGVLQEAQSRPNPSILPTIDIESERMIAHRALTSSRAVLAALAANSLVAKEGLEALQQPSPPVYDEISIVSGQEESNGGRAHSKSINLLDERISAHPIATTSELHSESSRSVLDSLSIFDGIDDGDEFWAMLAWLAPPMS